MHGGGGVTSLNSFFWVMLMFWDLTFNFYKFKLIFLYSSTDLWGNNLMHGGLISKSFFCGSINEWGFNLLSSSFDASGFNFQVVLGQILLMHEGNNS